MTKLLLEQRITDIINSIVEEILKASYVCKVILFGSYSKGNYTSESDIDIAIFIHDGSESIFNEFKRVTYLCLGYDVDIQPQIFYESELEDPIGIVGEIVEFGIELN